MGRHKATYRNITVALTRFNSRYPPTDYIVVEKLDITIQKNENDEDILKKVKEISRDKGWHSGSKIKPMAASKGKKLKPICNIWKKIDKSKLYVVSDYWQKLSNTSSNDDNDDDDADKELSPHLTVTKEVATLQYENTIEVGTTVTGETSETALDPSVVAQPSIFHGLIQQTTIMIEAVMQNERLSVDTRSLLQDFVQMISGDHSELEKERLAEVMIKFQEHCVKLSSEILREADFRDVVQELAGKVNRDSESWEAAAALDDLWSLSTAEIILAEPDLTVDEPMTTAQVVYDLGIPLMDPNYPDNLYGEGVPIAGAQDVTWSNILLSGSQDDSLSTTLPSEATHYEVD